jgi:choline dehydrogenase-like flavoprotein
MTRPPEWRAGFDHVVVGAGSAGAPLAARLSEEAGRQVLLVESGPDYATVAEMPAEMLARATSDGDIAHTWDLRAETSPGRVIDYPLGKVIGGSSAINSGVALRGAPADYDEWARLGCTGWGWRDVLPYFRRLETDLDFPNEFHGTRGPVPITRRSLSDLHPLHRALREAALALGYGEAADLNHPGASGVGVWPMNVRDGIRISTAMSYLTPDVRRRDNLHIWPEATVCRVLIEHGGVTGVEVRDRQGTARVRTGHVTLSAGAIATPGILLRSGIGGPDRVRAIGAEPMVDLPGVGENLMDHAFTWLWAAPAAGLCDLPARSVQVGLRYTASGSAEPDDMQVLAVLPVDISTDPALAAHVGADKAVMIGAGLQRPRGRGHVTWRNRDASPDIHLRLTQERHDVDRLTDGLRLAWRIARSPALAPYVRDICAVDECLLRDHDKLTRYLRDHLITFKHPAGTARMGSADDPDAVTDARCRVHGVEGLHVADASVMPTIPRANTNLTCIMIGERVADIIRGRGPAAVH